MSAQGSRFGDAWDRYVESFGTKKASFSERAGRLIEVPGDEWGEPDGWRRRVAVLFRQRLSAGAPILALEIGPGSGKYTRLFLEAFPESRIIACDVSARFLEILKTGNAEAIQSKRLLPELLEPLQDCLERAAAKHDAVGNVDCIFSIDSMVHVGLQYLVAYWQSALHILKPNGLLVMGVADATTPEGYQKLMRDVPSYFSKQGAGAFGQFEWMSAELAVKVLEKMGFVVELVPEASTRDCYFVATKGRRSEVRPQVHLQDRN
jgi:SAM-dependent methyltransferase